MTCEPACPFIGCGAHSALMGYGGTGSFLSSDPPDPTTPWTRKYKYIQIFHDCVLYFQKLRHQVSNVSKNNEEIENIPRYVGSICRKDLSLRLALGINETLFEK
jgi:hypothetical protein